MPIPAQHQFVLITDDAAEESHTAYILAKYHFSNSLVRIRNAAGASEYFASMADPGSAAGAQLPELILMSMTAAGGANRILGMESRTGALRDIPLIIAAWDREEEEAVKRLNLPRTVCISRPIGFFKLLEAMQKLGMRWMVLRPD